MCVDTPPTYSGDADLSRVWQVIANVCEVTGADVVAFDPVAVANTKAVLPTITYAGSAAEALDGADACVLVTEWPEFVHLDWARLKGTMRRPVIIDGRNALDGETLLGLGFTYEGVGVPTTAA